jgi:hypothetical protein
VNFLAINGYGVKSGVYSELALEVGYSVNYLVQYLGDFGVRSMMSQGHLPVPAARNRKEEVTKRDMKMSVRTLYSYSPLAIFTPETRSFRGDKNLLTAKKIYS